MEASAPNPGVKVGRRSFSVGAGVSLISAPPIVRAASLMPIRALSALTEPVHMGFVDRLRLYFAAKLLAAGWDIERARALNCGGMSEADARRMVANALRHRWVSATAVEG
jgi:hypothetical protein